MRRYIIALVALLMVMGLSLWGIVSTSPQAGAATTAPQFHFTADYTNWYPNYGYGWSVVGNELDNDSLSGNGVTYWFEIEGGSGGYNELAQVYLTGMLVWSETGYCAGWNASLQRIVLQTCNGATYQLWAGTGTDPDLIWNDWVETNYPHVCPISGGYTQQVITAEASGPDYLSCPQGAGGQSYLAKQMWHIKGA